MNNQSYTVRIETNKPGDLDQTVREAFLQLAYAVNWDANYAIKIEVTDAEGKAIVGHHYDPRVYVLGTGDEG